jgi:heavy metal sensor kinase
MIRSIRGRLTAWYSVVLAVVLVATGAISYGIMRRQIRRTTDAALTAAARQVANTLRDEAAENHGVLLPRFVAEVLNEYRDRDRPVALFTRDGRAVWSTSATPPPRAAGFATIDHVRFLYTPARLGATDCIIAVGQSLAAQEEMLADLRKALLLTIPLALLIASAGGYLLARKSLEPVAAMSAKARAIGATSLGERIEVRNERDELGQLATTLNGLLARLEEAFASQRRFMADASHELRTPVAILQGELDVALSRDDRDARDYRESLAIMQKSVRRLTRIVRDLFLLARGDAGQYPLRSERFYLDDVVAQTLHGFRTLAAERGVTLHEERAPDLVMRGDEDLVQRLVANLVENAIKHAPAGGDVTVRCSGDDGERRIEVRDNGRGIAPELHEKIFERFFRADSNGAGLGLPIARWIAEAHGGRVWLEASDERGTTFCAVLPAEGEPT